jgi:Fur family peroxide stress response transcriptional regulator
MIHSQVRLDELILKLRGHGYRLTPQRRAVLEILATADNHPTVEQIYCRVKEDFPMTSLATVYKTIAVLKDMGEIIILSFNDDSNHYDCKMSTPHPHLICVDCGRIVDLEIDGLSKTPQTVAESTGYRIVNHRFDFFGICPQCQEKE